MLEININIFSECNCGKTFKRRYVQEHVKRCILTKHLEKGAQKHFGKELMNNSDTTSVPCFLIGCGGLISRSNYANHFRPSDKKGKFCGNSVRNYLLSFYQSPLIRGLNHQKLKNPFLTHLSSILTLE